MGLQMAWQNGTPERRRAGPPLGLKNLGNTCYLNSVLQCLTYTPPLAQFCLASQHSSLCKTLITNKERECPFCIIERQIVRSLSLDCSIDNPSKILKCISLFAEHFRWGRQEDAHEFLRYVIDACHSTCLKLLKRLATSGNGVASNGVRAIKKDDAKGACMVMKQIFGGVLLSQVKCLSCKEESNKNDEIMDISLDLYESNSLKDALIRFFQPEVLDGSNKYSCERCKSLSIAKKQMFLLRAPNVLVIQLKRFESIHGGKIHRTIEFEEMLELSNYMHKSAQDSHSKYSLFGSIVHSGHSPDSGHYYAYIKDSSGRWYCCNDTHISLSSTREVLSEKVYILFYLCCDQTETSSNTCLTSNEVKPSYSNLKDASTFGITAGPAEPLSTRVNQFRPSDSLVFVPKNDKISTNPLIKSISLKNFETSRLSSNGNGMVEVSTDERSNNATSSPSVKASHTSLEDNACSASPCRKHIVVDKGGMQNLPSRNGNQNCPLIIAQESNTASNLLTGKSDPTVEDLPDAKVNEQNALVSTCKLNMHDIDKAVDLVPSADKHSSLPSNDVKQPPRELNKFMDLLASNARSALRSCDWYCNVHDFMHARKRLYTQVAGPCPSKAELKKILINGAREKYNSQVPGSLKSLLVKRLKEFSESNSLSDI